MQVDIYRPESRSDLFLFVRAGTDPKLFLSDMMASIGGNIKFVKSRDLSPGQKVIGANTDEILQNIARAGFHVQGTTVATQVSEGGAAIGGGILGASVGGPIGALIGAIIGFAVAEHAKKVPDDL